MPNFSQAAITLVEKNQPGTLQALEQCFQHPDTSPWHFHYTETGNHIGHCAARHPDNGAVIMYLIKKEPDVAKALNKERNTPLRRALVCLEETQDERYWNNIIAFASSSSCPQDDRNKALFHAVCYQNIASASALLKYGAQATYYSSTTGHYLLGIAVSKKHLEMVQLLMRYGVRPDESSALIPGKHSVTPATLAAELNYRELFTEMTEKSFERAYLVKQVKDNKPDVVRRLLRHRLIQGELEQKLAGKTPLSWAIHHENKDLAELLLKYGAQATTENKKIAQEKKLGINWDIDRIDGSVPKEKPEDFSCIIARAQTGVFNELEKALRSASTLPEPAASEAASAAAPEGAQSHEMIQKLLYWAAFHGNYDAILCLIRHGANLNEALPLLPDAAASTPTAGVQQTAATLLVARQKTGYIDNIITYFLQKDLSHERTFRPRCGDFAQCFAALVAIQLGIMTIPYHAQQFSRTLGESEYEKARAPLLGFLSLTKEHEAAAQLLRPMCLAFLAVLQNNISSMLTVTPEERKKLALAVYIIQAVNVHLSSVPYKIDQRTGKLIFCGLSSTQDPSALSFFQAATQGVGANIEEKKGDVHDPAQANPPSYEETMDTPKEEENRCVIS